MKIVARLSSKTEQGECRTSSSLERYAEPQPVLFKNIDKVVVAKMTKPRTKAEKAKSGDEVPLPGGSLSPKPNIMYIEANRYTENTTLPHSIYTL